ncbi:hypothetical protein SAMN05216276_108113 [Streptosporangium subroseum]|uniref:Uncharacterized protein n=1 Tax=Streptosporangium subroseum TaxID=106412 RepID=A0A239P2P2_9ACTN|nr:hypothetical protein [Streptosporangium subroseum]SNT60993.1 hypothetical protein SAMN05216276_108113 [Streptosporangium subroseum]
MVRFRQEVSIEPLSRRWLEDVVEAFHDAVEGLDFTGDRFVDPSGGAEIRLIEGRHITTGTRYELVPFDSADRLEHEVPDGAEAPSDLLITSWNRDVETGIQLTFGTDSYSATWAMKLCSAHRPRTLMTHIALTGNHRLVREITILAEIDLERWWQQLDGHGSRTPAVTARVTHHLFTGTLKAVPHTTGDNRWGLAVTVAGRGRSWARPLAALTAVFLYAVLRRAVTKKIIDAAHTWDKTVVDVRTESPAEAARRILVYLFTPPDDLPDYQDGQP